MTYWYVDCENIGYRYEVLIEHLKRYDRVVFCYTEVTPFVPFTMLDAMSAKDVRFEFLYCLAGAPNAADFQILMAVAANITNGIGQRHVVYSNDMGYDIPLSAWRAKGHMVDLLTLNQETSSVVTVDAALMHDLREAGMTPAQIIDLKRYIRRGMSPQKLNGAVGKIVTGDMQSRVYKICKQWCCS